MHTVMPYVNICLIDSDKEEENDSDVNNASTYQKSVGTEES